MGKHKKLPAQPTAAAPPPPEPTADATSPLADVEAGLREAFAAARAMAANGDAPIQVLRELGGLGRAITTVQAERRAQSKAKEYTARTLPIEVLMEALRLMNSERRAHVRRELDAMDNTESVLG